MRFVRVMVISMVRRRRVRRRFVVVMVDIVRLCREQGVLDWLG